MDKALLEKALNMSPKERLTFAELILASIDREDEEVKQAWLNEVKDRINAFNEGKAKLLDFEGLVDED
ncbi:addiction module protein [bacterium]|nr:addiction module protein [bacterium]